MNTKQKKNVILAVFCLLFLVIGTIATVLVLQNPQEIRQRADTTPAPLCPVEGANCEWDTDPSVARYKYKITESGTTEVTLKEGELLNPQIDLNTTSKQYQIRKSCKAGELKVYWTKADTAVLYQFILYDVTTNPGGVIVGRVTIDSGAGGIGTLFQRVGADDREIPNTVYIPDMSKKYSIAMFEYQSAGAQRSEVITGTEDFTCTEDSQKLRVTFTSEANKTYRCSVTPVNMCGDGPVESVSQLCSVPLSATPTFTPTPTVTTPITPTPQEITCGYTPCNTTDKQCPANMTCVTTSKGNYCAMPLLQNACIQNPSTETCCNAAPTLSPTLTPTQTPTPTITPKPTLTPTPTPTVTPIVTPTIIPTPIVVITQPPLIITQPPVIVKQPPIVITSPPIVRQPLPAAGDEHNSVVIGAGGFLLSLLGALLFFAL